MVLAARVILISEHLINQFLLCYHIQRIWWIALENRSWWILIWQSNNNIILQSVEYKSSAIQTTRSEVAVNTMFSYEYIT